MKVLIVSQYFWPENFRVNDIAEYLSKKGYEIDIYTSYPSYPNKEIYEDLKYNDKNFLKNTNIIRIPSFSRGKGGSVSIFLNYFTFILSGIFFSHFKLYNKKYDYIFTFATSPVTVSLLSIYINFFKRAKLVIWLLDYWPDIIFELKYIKSRFNKFLLNLIVNYIYKKQDCILAQSNAYLKKIKNSQKNLKNKKLIYFPSWPEEIEKFHDSDIDKVFQSYEDYIKIVFTGNVGEAQGFEKVIEFCQKYENLKFKIFVVGTGRWIEKIKQDVIDKKIDKLVFFGHKPKNKIYQYLDKADVLLISLKKGEVFDATIPGKFSTYLKFNKPIFGLIGGETNNLINENKLGLAVDNLNLNNLDQKVLSFFENLRKINLNNEIYTEKNFSKKNILSRLDSYFNSQKVKLKFIKKVEDISFDSNFVLSAFNLAFIGSWISKEINIYDDLCCWPDGFFKETLLKNVPKLPGRDLIKYIKLPNYIKKIRIIGNSSPKVESFLKNNFKIEDIINNQLPYGDINSIKKSIDIKLENDELTLITLPTPKQEIIAEHLKNINENFHIICIGGGLRMASGEEKPPPKILENYGLETVWRLRNETFRRLRRLGKSFSYFIKGYFKNEIKNILITNNEKEK